MVEKYKDVSNLEIYCGGVPLNAIPPFYYNIVFGNKLPIDLKKAFLKAQNNILETVRFEGLSNIFIKNIGLLESYHDGLIPFFAQHLNVPNISQKTLRWKGFTKSVQILRECGMLSDEKLSGYNVLPNEFLHTVLKSTTIFP